MDTKTTLAKKEDIANTKAVLVNLSSSGCSSSGLLI